MRSVVIHAHFYQPPREDPRTDRVPREPSAHPFHDWNERVLAECYRPVTEARILAGDGRIRGIVNTLDQLSWDAGPTLLRWMAREAPDTYRAFVEADARSVRQLGHGNALAAPFHHVILPLASLRDKITEVRWGIEDFRRRFGREPEGMWLPETAVDTETLEVLAGEGIRFTILAPHQVRGAPASGAPGRVELPGGGSVAVFPYDGGLSHGVAFGRLLKDSEAWVGAVREAHEGRSSDLHAGAAPLVTIATDGETYGHHHRWGDMALAATVERLVAEPELRLENPASYLARHGPAAEVELVEETSWSCAHGIERWRADCGCRMDVELPPAQGWREPLRAGLEELADGLHALYESGAKGWVVDPWEARNRYGAVVDGGPEARERFARDVLGSGAGEAEVADALRLLEMERDALRMFTSCGWFFDDIGGLEPVQVLEYAAHALDGAEEEGIALESRLLTHLEGARSSDPEVGDGQRLWEETVRGDRAREEPGPRDEPVREADAPRPGDDAPEAALRRDQAAFWSELEDLLPEERIPLAPRAAALGFSDQALTFRPLRASDPLRFVLGIHVHQPVGNFDEVFADHAETVYEPLLRALEEGRCLPAALHVSGPLLEWLDGRGHPFLDRVGRLAADGSLELLLSGFHEPILPALERADRLIQIAWMKDWLTRRFGVDATGLWLTERVWEPDLAGDLAEAGVRYVFLDDWHFKRAELEGRDLHRPFRTVWGGAGIDVLPIDERLRYLVPFRPPEELASYLLDLKAAGRQMAVLADDGEKFGGWPGTAAWVWEAGWMERFLSAMTRLVDQGDVRMVTPSQALAEVPADGPVYVPSGSYREMEIWARGGQASAGRFGHWRNFLTRYPESNRMHKKAQALSRLCRERGEPVQARRSVGMAQCNDSYWHGVFGGLYLRHLREAVWANLARAEEVLRAGEGLEAESLDLDGDGAEEIWLHSAHFSAQVAPARGGGIEELTFFQLGRNLADTLTRRREAYHLPAAEGEVPEEAVAQAPGKAPGKAEDPAHQEGGMPSIHEREDALAFDALPPVDSHPRAILVDRILPAGVSDGEYQDGRFDPVRSWAPREMAWRVEESDGGSEGVGVSVHLECQAPGRLRKSLRFREDGSVEVAYRWDPAEYPEDALFATEMSLAWEPDLAWEVEPVAVRRFEIRTVSKTEAGSEETVQGLSLTPVWPVSLGEARFTIGGGSPDRAAGAATGADAEERPE
jgi:alpha-amylase/alpha-mannosidase (GH57 family)